MSLLLFFYPFLERSYANEVVYQLIKAFRLEITVHYCVQSFKLLCCHFFQSCGKIIYPEAGRTAPAQEEKEADPKEGAAPQVIAAANPSRPIERQRR